MLLVVDVIVWGCCVVVWSEQNTKTADIALNYIMPSQSSDRSKGRVWSCWQSLVYFYFHFRPDCGLFGWRPAWLQNYARGWVIVALMISIRWTNNLCRVSNADLTTFFHGGLIAIWNWKRKAILDISSSRYRNITVVIINFPCLSHRSQLTFL